MTSQCVGAGVDFLANEESSLIEPEVVDTEKVLNCVMRALRDHI